MLSRAHPSRRLCYSLILIIEYLACCRVKPATWVFQRLLQKVDNQAGVAYENDATQPPDRPEMPALTTVKETRRSPSKKPLDTDAMLENARKASDFLKALSHEARLCILCLLIDGEKSVGEIEQALDLRQAAVSQQLARLRADGVVKMRRDGKSVYYSIARPEVLEVMSALYRAFCR